MTSSRRWRPVYRLLKNEEEYCRQLALVRNNTKLGKIPDHRVDRAASSLEVNFHHIKALYAVARLLGAPLPTERDLAPIKSTSFLTYADWKVMVRFNNTREGDFYLPPAHGFLTDAAVLCYTAPMAKYPEPNLPGIQMAGWLTREDWDTHKFSRDYGWGSVQAVLQMHLRDFRDLEQRENQLTAPVQGGLFGGTA